MLSFLRTCNYSTYKDWLEISPRKLTVLVGPNGSGKSSIFRLIKQMFAHREEEQKGWEKLLPAEGPMHLEIACERLSDSLSSEIRSGFVAERTQNGIQIMRSSTTTEAFTLQCEGMSNGSERFISNLLHQPIEFTLTRRGFDWNDHLEDEGIIEEAAQSYRFFMREFCMRDRGKLHGFPFATELEEHPAHLYASAKAVGEAELDADSFVWRYRQLEEEDPTLLYLVNDLRGYTLLEGYRIGRELQESINSESSDLNGDRNDGGEDINYAGSLPSDARELDMIGQFAERKYVFNDARIDQYFGALISRLKDVEKANQRLATHNDKERFIRLSVRWTVLRFCDLALHRARELRRKHLKELSGKIFLEQKTQIWPDDNTDSLFLRINKLQEEQVNRLNYWLKRFHCGLRFSAVNDPKVSWKLESIATGDSVTPFEISTGIRQIVEFLLTSELNIGTKFFYEHPENNLHPGAQAVLADLFTDIALKNQNQIFVETHSEAFLTRLLQLMEENELPADDVAIYLVSVDENHHARADLIAPVSSAIPEEKYDVALEETDLVSL